MSELVALLLLLGAFSGFLAGLLGIGGGLIIVPALLYLLAPSVDQSILMHTSIGTALAAIVFTLYLVSMRIKGTEQYFGIILKS